MLFYLLQSPLKKIVVKLSGKHQCQNLFLNKDKLKLPVASIKDTPVKVFSWEC